MKSIADCARELAAFHRREDPQTCAAYFLPAPDAVCLIEVLHGFGSGGEVLPFGFTPRLDLGVPHPSIVVLLGTGDWERVQRGELQLPTGWSLDRLQIIY